jgi:hypothetical protein
MANGRIVIEDAENVVAEIKGNHLLLDIDMSKELGPSSTGKTMLVATTRGNKLVPGCKGLKIAVNAYHK